MSSTRLLAIARSPLLLVASDFDGTISPLVSTPSEARIDARCAEALARLSALACTNVSVISGRGVLWLREATRAIPGAMLYGSHGAEEVIRTGARDGDGDVVVDVCDNGAVARVGEAFEALAARWPGCLVERKAVGVAFHYRQADPSSASEIIAEAERTATVPGVVVRHGSMVVEAAASTKTKGDAIRRATYRSGASHVIFLGDDTTDEDAFKALGEHDVSVKVGEGETSAIERVGSVKDVAEVLEALAHEREVWLGERALVPIQSHSILSDQRTIALVSPDARVTWLCAPRIDSSALFAELLGGVDAGFFAIEAEDGRGPLSQAYLPNSLLLRTDWGSFWVTDYLDCSGGRGYQRAGRTDLVRVIEGKGRVRVRLAPRQDFGRSGTTVVVHEHGLELMVGSDPCVVHSPGVAWHVHDDGTHHTAEAIVDLDAIPGGEVVLELRYGTGNLKASVVSEAQRRILTQGLWSGWADSLRVPMEYRDVVVRSALAIKALGHGPSGAIAAAGTTSLPEQLGGVRNWDYRFCWPRDAAMAATALLRLGNTGMAMSLTDWLVGVVDGLDSPARLRPIYAVRGEDLGPEAEIGDLRGYAGSRPIRISNAASQQVQLDVFGPIVDMVATMAERGVGISPDSWRLVRSMVQAVEARWEEPDHGIWEIRGARRHHVHSKVMCWHAVDRALVVHDAVLGKDNAEWRTLRDRIRDDVLAQGWNEKVRAFTTSYHGEELDAAALTIGLTGLLPHDDPRWAMTVDAVDKGLREGATVYRYRCDDGLPGTEGGFVICACWLIEAFVTLGRLREAKDLLDGVIAQAGPTGLLAEQWDPVHTMALGNFPQAYSHLGVINAALALTGAAGR